MASLPFVRQAVHRTQQGVVMVIALVLLLVIAFSSAFILRNALFGDSTTNNLVASQSANHAAEVALRYCEELVLNPPAVNPPPVQPLPDTQQAVAWQVAANWENVKIRVNVPSATLSATGRLATVQYAQLPQCIIEQVQIRALDSNGIKPYGLQITARGYSADYQRTAGNRTGSEVILQSILRMPNCNQTLKMDC